MDKHLKVNIGYQTFYQILAVITPLVTSPHISRVLQADNLGKFTYSYTTVLYFSLVCLLGVANYGSRTIAQCKDDVYERSRTFVNIYSFQFISSTIAILAYIGYVFLILPLKGVENIEITIAIIQIVTLVGYMFDVNWFFFGIEAFRITVTRNISIKILTVICILIFVKKEHSPLIVYTLIMSIGNFLSYIMLIPILFKKLVFVKPTWIEMRKHIIPNIKLFIPLIATSVYHIMDKSMLGDLVVDKGYGTKAELGYYYNADKLINIPLGVINGFGIVLLPRVSRMIAEKKSDSSILRFLDETIEINISVTCLLSFGIAGCAKEFIPLFFGSGYEKCIILTYIFAPVLIFKATSSFFRMQYLVPKKLEKVYIYSTIAGAIVNLIFNLVLIPDEICGIRCGGLGSVGAVIGTLIAEIVVVFVQFIFCHERLPIIKWTKVFVTYSLIGFCEFLCMRCVSVFFNNKFISVILEILTGGIVFILFTLLYFVFTGRKNTVISTVKQFYK